MCTINLDNDPGDFEKVKNKVNGHSQCRFRITGHGVGHGVKVVGRGTYKYTEIYVKMKRSTYT